jgi:DNA polymerase elongation subunit (family B)
MSLDPLITDPYDRRVFEAAEGSHPPLQPGTLPERRLRFALNEPTYRISPHGDGTLIRAYGTTTTYHEIGVTLSGFYPYCQVLRDPCIEPVALIELLQVTIGFIIALDTKRQWAPERRAMQRGAVGVLSRNGLIQPPSFDLARRARPIVGWEVVDGTLSRGMGASRGYNGLAPQQFIKIYFYCPRFLVIARSLLHGKFAELGPYEQARQLALSKGRGADLDEGKAAKVFDTSQRVLFDTDDTDQDAAREMPMTDDDPDELMLDEALAAAMADEENDGGDEDDQRESFADETVYVEKPDVALERRYVRTCAQAFDALRSDGDYLARLRPDACATVADAGLDFVLRFATDAGIAYEQWVEIDCDAPPLVPTRVERLYETSNSDNDSPWQLADTPPGIAPIDCDITYDYDQQTRYDLRTQIRIRCDWHHLRRVVDDELQQTLPYHSQLALDCEMLPGPNGAFPNPDTEPVLTIGNVFSLVPTNPARVRYVAFTYLQTATASTRTDDAEERTLCFASQETMIIAYANFVRALSPDFVISFNGDAFDLPYLDRAAARYGDLVQEHFRSAWGKAAGSRLRMEPRVFRSKIHGTHRYTDVSIEGAIPFDAYQYFKRSGIKSENGYSLEALSQKILNDRKGDVSYADIAMHQSTPFGRRFLTVYCLKDAMLAWRLLQEYEVFPEMMQRARITGVTVQMLLKRGMQIQCKTVVSRSGRAGLLIPEAAKFIGIRDAGQRRMIAMYTRTELERSRERNDSYGGATVIPPECRLYTSIVATLDFNSLYPSIMASLGMDWLTLIRPDFRWQDDPWCSYLVKSGAVRAEDLFHSVHTYDERSPVGEFRLIKSPNDVRFLQQPVLTGLMPTVLIDLVTRRKGVKKTMKPLEEAMKSATGEELSRLKRKLVPLDKEQLVLKLVANSTYGYTGSPTSESYSRDIADSVTRTGRVAIAVAKHTAEHLATKLPESFVKSVCEFQALKSPVISIPSGVDVIANLRTQLATARSELAEYRAIHGVQAEKSMRMNRSLKDMFGVSAVTKKTDTNASDAAAAPAAVAADNLAIEVIYGDTDSIFEAYPHGVSPLCAALTSMAIADLISIRMHQMFGTQMRNACLFRIDFEKEYRSLVVWKKKRYAGEMLVWHDESKNVISKGIKGSGLETNRRDTTQIVRDGLSKVLKIMLLDHERTADQRLAYARAFIYGSVVDPIKRGTVSLRKIGLSKQLRQPPELYTAATPESLPPHVQLTMKMYERAGSRDAPNVPRPGDRVSYVICAGSEEISHASRAEDPLYVVQNRMQIDSEYYLSRHVEPAFVRVLEPLVLGNCKDIAPAGASADAVAKIRKALVRERLFGPAPGYAKPADFDRHDISDLKDKQQFAHGAAYVRYPPRRGGGSVRALNVVQGAECADCNSFEPDRRPGFVCAACVARDPKRAAERRNAQLIKLRDEMEDLMVERGRIFATCHKCLGRDGKPDEPINCMNSICPVFWERIPNEATLVECRARITDVLK